MLLAELPSKNHKIQAAMTAPLGSHILLPDSVVIEHAGHYQIVTPSARSASLNEIIFSSFADDNVEAAIEAACLVYSSQGLPFRWSVGPWTQPANLGDYLQARACSSWEVRAMLCLTSLNVAAVNGVEVHEVNIENIEDFLEVSEQGWGKEFGTAQKQGFRSDFLQNFNGVLRRRSFIAYVNGIAAGAASFLLKDGFGYLAGASVAPFYRNKGVYRALIAARLAKLRELRLPFAVTHARETSSAPILAKLGFETIFRYKIYLFPS